MPGGGVPRSVQRSTDRGNREEIRRDDWGYLGVMDGLRELHGGEGHWPKVCLVNGLASRPFVRGGGENPPVGRSEGRSPFEVGAPTMRHVIGMFESRSEAERAIEQLKASGIRTDSISVAMKDTT